MNIGFLGRIFSKSPWDNFEEENIFTRKRKENLNFKGFNYNFSPKFLWLLLIAAAVLWLASGFYKLEEGEESVITRFGKFNRTGTPGLNYRLPAPFEETTVEKVNQSRRIEIGYRSNERSRGSDNLSSRDVSPESIMLTGDENIVELNVDVMWHISDLPQYLFNVVNPQETLKAVAESSIREVIGSTPIASVLSNQKQAIGERIEKLIQQILNQYSSGIEIEQVQLLKAEPPKEVIQAYRDVQTSKADKEKEINQARAYNNNIIPVARGEAVKIRQEAEGYKAETVARAKGDASRFNAVYEQYVLNKNITRDRLYLETVEEILRDSKKSIIGGEGVLPHMSIEDKNAAK